MISRVKFELTVSAKLAPYATWSFGTLCHFLSRITYLIHKQEAALLFLPLSSDQSHLNHPPGLMRSQSQTNGGGHHILSFYRLNICKGKGQLWKYLFLIFFDYGKYESTNLSVVYVMSSLHNQLTHHVLGLSLLALNTCLRSSSRRMINDNTIHLNQSNLYPHRLVRVSFFVLGVCTICKKKPNQTTQKPTKKLIYNFN